MSTQPIAPTTPKPLPRLRALDHLVVRIIEAELAQHGQCDLSNAALAELAGVAVRARKSDGARTSSSITQSLQRLKAHGRIDVELRTQRLIRT